MSKDESNLKHLNNDLKPEDFKNKDESFWKENLTEIQYKVTQESATEAPFTGKFDHHFEKGHYFCSCCGDTLFKSESKFDSGCGWPAFSEVAAQGKISYHEDNSFGRQRIEVRCGNCDAHLGHVFNDGPMPGGKRYCINSVCLGFNKEES